ncbi:MAG: PQQ-dependent sugar dehydrogenase, partial [Pseudomonadota bacterium]
LIRIADGGRGARTELGGVPEVASKGQGGLLDLALHPDYATNGWLYFSYARPQRGGSQTAVARARLTDSALVDVETVFAPAQASRGGRHYGSRLAFDRDGYLYITVGDRGDRDRNPQDLGRVAGKVHRVHDDGRVPADNPFVDRSGAVASVWSWGHRNPQGMVRLPDSDALILHEHGPRGGDELNRVERAANYGWPLATFGINYYGTEITPHTALDGTVSPLMHWTPSIAPSGLAVVQDPALPELAGELLVGSLKFAEIHRVRLTAAGDGVAEHAVLLETPGRVRNLYTGVDGTLFVAVTGSGLYKLVRD